MLLMQILRGTRIYTKDNWSALERSIFKQFTFFPGRKDRTLSGYTVCVKN